MEVGGGDLLEGTGRGKGGRNGKDMGGCIALHSVCMEGGAVERTCMDVDAQS